MAVKDNDTVSKIGSHDEIVLDDESSLLGVHNEALDDTGCDNTLFRIEVSTRLIDEVDISWHAEGQYDSDTLQFTTGQVLHFLVDEVVHLEGLVDIGLELRAEESGLDLLEEELANGTLEPGSDGLGLHADAHLGNLGVAIGLQSAGKHLTESGLSGTVLTHHDDDLRVSKGTGLDVEFKASEGLLHAGVAVATVVVNHVFVASLCDAKLQRFLTETQVFGGNVTIQEDVDTFTDGCWQCDDTVDGGLSVENADEVGKVIEDGQIVLDDNDIVIGAEQTADLAGGSETLLDIQEGRRLVKHVHIGLLDADKRDGETLQFSTRELSNVTVEDVSQLKLVNHLVEVLHLGAGADELADGAVGRLDSLGKLVDILGLDDGLEIVFQDLCEVVCALLASAFLVQKSVSYSGVQNHGSISRSPPSLAGCRNDRGWA